jgi:ribosomal protein S18 acetylase RimI-like enzyme
MAEPVTVRDAEPAEFAAIGELRVGAYAAGSFLADASNYGPTLRTLAIDGTGQILAAEADGQLLGTVTLQLPPHAGQVVRGPDEAEVRALAVSPDAQGRGVGRALLRTVIERARQMGVRHLVLSTQSGMDAARYLYSSAGFVRLPDRDWSPAPGFTLLAYGLPLELPPGEAEEDSVG